MLAEKIRERAGELGMNQTALARRSGLSIQYVNALWNGKHAGRLSVGTVQKLKKGLRVGHKFFYSDESLVKDETGTEAVGAEV